MPTAASKGVRGDDAVVLCRHQRNPRVDQFLLRIEYIERGTLADARLFTHAIERDLSGVDLRGGRLDLCLCGDTSCPQFCTTVARA